MKNKSTIISLISIFVICICFIFMVSMAKGEKINNDNENISEFTPVVIEKGYVNFFPIQL